MPGGETQGFLSSGLGSHTAGAVLQQDQPSLGAALLEAEPRQQVAFLNSSEGGGRARV